jgi:hypothetical protein
MHTHTRTRNQGRGARLRLGCAQLGGGVSEDGECCVRVRV